MRIELPEKLTTALRQLDKEKQTLLQGWVFGRDDVTDQHRVLPDYSALVIPEESKHVDPVA